MNRLLKSYSFIREEKGQNHSPPIEIEMDKVMRQLFVISVIAIFGFILQERSEVQQQKAKKQKGAKHETVKLDTVKQVPVKEIGILIKYNKVDRYHTDVEITYAIKGEKFSVMLSDHQSKQVVVPVGTILHSRIGHVYTDSGGYTCEEWIEDEFKALEGSNLWEL